MLCSESERCIFCLSMYTIGSSEGGNSGYSTISTKQLCPQQFNQPSVANPFKLSHRGSTKIRAKENVGASSIYFPSDICFCAVIIL